MQTIATFHKGHLQALAQSDPNIDDKDFRFLYESSIRDFRENKDYIPRLETGSVIPFETREWAIWRPIALLYVVGESVDYWSVAPSINQFWLVEDQNCRAPVGSRFIVKRVVWPDEIQEWTITKIAEHPCRYPWRHEQQRYLL